MDYKKLISSLEKGFSENLTGKSYQYEMAPGGRLERELEALETASPKESSVLILVTSNANTPLIPIIERTRKPNSAHSGQISFPGGRWEESDRDLEFTALRETEEEIGISKEEVQIIGKLSPLYIPVSNFRVHPFVGFIGTKPEFQPESREVERILEINPFDFQKGKKKQVGKVKTDLGMTFTVPYFDVHGHKMWGASAMIFNEFLHLTGL